MLRNRLAIGDSEPIEDPGPPGVLGEVSSSRDHVDVHVRVLRMLCELNCIGLDRIETLAERNGCVLEQRPELGGLSLREVSQGGSMFSADKNQPAFDRGAVAVSQIPRVRSEDLIPRRCFSPVSSLYELARSTRNHSRESPSQRAPTADLPRADGGPRVGYGAQDLCGSTVRWPSAIRHSVRTRLDAPYVFRQPSVVSQTKEQFVDQLLDAAPEVQPLVDEHLADFDEVLLHLLIARVRDMAIAAFDGGNRQLAGRIVAVMDEGLRHGDEGVENAVAVSFVEDTPWWDPDRKKFMESWPQALRDEAERQKNRSP